MLADAMNGSQFKQWLHTEAFPSAGQPLVMGILNVTPDSFSDAGQFASADAALAHARQMIADGADLLDIGGESTRPGSTRISPSEQITRILPVLERLRQESDIAISVDTTLSEVARAVAAAGADILNDISAGRDDPGMFAVAAENRLPLVLMHMQGEPGTMQNSPTYTNVTLEVAAFLRARAGVAVAAGVSPADILIDPGIGFGKTLEHNLALLRELPAFAAMGHRLLLGVSRKRFLGTLTGVAQPAQRIHSSVAAHLWCAMHGAHILRVHDVLPTIHALKVFAALQLDDTNSP